MSDKEKAGQTATPETAPKYFSHNSASIINGTSDAANAFRQLREAYAHRGHELVRIEDPSGVVYASRRWGFERRFESFAAAVTWCVENLGGRR